MTTITLFKELASKKLSAPLFEELEQHIESIFNDIQMMEYFEYESVKENSRKLRKIKLEFYKLVKPNWPDFARERWPEIETYFKLEDGDDEDNWDIPF